MSTQTAISITDLRQTVERLALSMPVTDMHTHLYAPEFGELLLWGIDELLTYHYLISESFRWSEEDYSHFWSMSKREQADWIWKQLFLDHSPVSEAGKWVYYNPQTPWF